MQKRNVLIAASAVAALGGVTLILKFGAPIPQAKPNESTAASNGYDAKPISHPDSRPLSEQRSPMPSPGPSKELSEDLAIYNELVADDSTRRNDAVQKLQKMVRLNRSKMTSDVQPWIRPLLQAGLYDEVLSLTEEVIPSHADNSSLLADATQARVKSLLAQQKWDSAIGEAARSYDVATQKTARRSLNLLIKALREGGHVDLADEIAKDQGNALPPGSQRAWVQKVRDIGKFPSIDEKTIVRASRKSELAEANLLLMQGKTDQAKATLEQALDKLPRGGKKAHQLLEGMATCLRAKSGLLVSGDAFVHALRRGDLRSSYVGNIDGSLMRASAQTLRDGGARVDLTSQHVDQGTDADPAIQESLDHAGAVLEAMMSLDNGNSQDQWRLTAIADLFASAKAGDLQPDHVESHLQKIGVNAETAFKMAAPFQRRFRDTAASAVFYKIAAAHVDQMTGPDYKPNSQIASMLKSYRQDYKKVLWDQIDNKSNLAAVLTLKTFYSAFVKTCPADQPELLADLPSFQIGLAECYYKLKQYEFALDILGEIDGLRLRKNEVYSYSWVHAMCLSKLQRWVEAVPHLQFVVSNQNPSPYRADAQCLLVITLGRSAQYEEAVEAAKALEDGNNQSVMLTEARMVANAAQQKLQETNN